MLVVTPDQPQPHVPNPWVMQVVAQLLSVILVTCATALFFFFYGMALVMML